MKKQMQIFDGIAAVLTGLFMGTMGGFSRKTGLDGDLPTVFRPEEAGR